MDHRRRLMGGIALGLGALLIASAAWLLWGGGRPRPPATPTAGPTSLPTFTPYAPPTAGEPGAALRVRCNVPASVWLTDYWTGAQVAAGTCSKQPLEWSGLRPAGYNLHAYNYALDMEMQKQVNLYDPETELALVFPGVLLVRPIPEEAEVEVDGKVYHGETRVSFPGEQCPYTATVWVRASGYQTYGTNLAVEAGLVHRQDVALEALPTPISPPVTARPTLPPVTTLPTVPPFTVEERVELVRQKLYEKVNCWRAEGGMGPVPYLSEWQVLADEFARAWRDHFRQYGVEGFDDTPWRQQFQAAGGDAVPDGAAFDLYAPDYYIYIAPATRWETFNMCDPGCPQYGHFRPYQFDRRPISGVVIGMAPWWEGDILEAAVVVGIRW